MRVLIFTLLPYYSGLGRQVVRDGRVVDGPEGGAVLQVVPLSLRQDALVDPLKVVNIHSEGEGDAGQQP